MRSLSICLALQLVALPSLAAIRIQTTPRAPSPVALAKKTSKSKGGGKGGGGKGFGATKGSGFGAKPESATQPTPKPAKAPPELVAIDLGREKSVSVYLPPQRSEEKRVSAEDLELLSTTKLKENFGHLYGAGDVVWPASISLARLLAHVPSLTQGKRVLELGCGLGAAGLAAASVGAASVLLTDRDTRLLALAKQAAAANDLGDESVLTATLDWTADEATILEAVAPVSPVEVIIGADLLYDESTIPIIARLLNVLLPKGPEEGRVLLADPEQRMHREALQAACEALGLSVADDVLPGPEAMRLVGVTRS